jgi:adenylate cyclase
MALSFMRFSISTRKKLASILLAVTIFALLAGLVTLVQGRPVVFGVLNAIFVGAGVGLFEQFYVQSSRGRWFRGIHPLLSILLYTIVVAILFVAATNFSHLLLSGLYPSPVPYNRLPFVLPRVIAIAVVGIVVMRAVHFIGIDTLDINDSTGLAERLGAMQVKALVGKFLFDISKPITDYGGEIYLYKGDGLIALWDWQEAIRADKILRAIDAIFACVRREYAQYQRQFSVAPTFRIGVHGGDVVVSEQGDTKRSIGIYGISINIASPMEEAAKAHRALCAISGDVAQELSDAEDRLHFIGSEKIKGISAELPIFQYRIAGEPVAVAVKETSSFR